MSTSRIASLKRKLGIAVAGSVAAASLAAAPAHAAVNGTIYANGLNTPGGGVWMGSHLWVSDHVSGLCRLDKNATTGKFTINAATCSLPVASVGQPSFDAATNSVYVPDNSSKGTTVARLKFDPVSETVRPSASISVGAFGARPSSTALGPDGSLYVGFTRGNNLVRVANPASAPSASLVGTTAAGGAAGLAVANASDGSLAPALYVAEGGGVSEIDNPAACAGSCAAFMTNIVPQTVVNGKVILWETTAIAATDANTLYVAKWAPHDFGPKVTIVQDTISTGSVVDYSTSYTAPDGKLQPWTTVSSLSANPAGGLFVGHDPTNGGTNGALISSLP